MNTFATIWHRIKTWWISLSPCYYSVNNVRQQLSNESEKELLQYLEVLMKQSNNNRKTNKKTTITILLALIAIEELSSGKRSEDEVDSIAEDLIYDFILHHKNDSLGLRVLTGVATDYLQPARWFELLETMKSKQGSNPTLANELMKHPSRRRGGKGWCMEVR